MKASTKRAVEKTVRRKGRMRKIVVAFSSAFWIAREAPLPTGMNKKLDPARNSCGAAASTVHAGNIAITKRPSLARSFEALSLMRRHRLGIRSSGKVRPHVLKAVMIARVPYVISRTFGNF